MIRQRSLTLGVVTAGLRFIGPSQTLNAVVAEADRMGYALLLKELPRFDTQEIEPILRSLLTLHVDGLIWAVPEVGDNREWLKENRRLPVPIVFLTMRDFEPYPVVRVDNRCGAYLATHHLIEQGYRAIGHISGPLDWWEAQERLAGWRDALLEAGLPDSDSHWVEGNWSSASGYRAVQQLMEQYLELDSIFAANDQMALSALLEAQRRGKRVPQDLGIAGFDGLAEAEFFNPPLTTVVQDLRALGSAAVRTLVRLIQEVEEPGSQPPQEETVILPSLIVRESSLRQRS
jgi:LacI family transcriptional regulator